jgi:hypothetical protein
MTILIILAGFALLIAGAEALVGGMSCSFSACRR